MSRGSVSVCQSAGMPGVSSVPHLCPFLTTSARKVRFAARPATSLQSPTHQLSARPSYSNQGAGLGWFWSWQGICSSTCCSQNRPKYVQRLLWRMQRRADCLAAWYTTEAVVLVGVASHISCFVKLGRLSPQESSCQCMLCSCTIPERSAGTAAPGLGGTQTLVPATATFSMGKGVAAFKSYLLLPVLLR